MFACQAPSNGGEDGDQSTTTTAEESEQPDYATFDSNVEAAQAFIKAHCEEDLQSQMALVSDTMQWSPPYYNGNEWLGKDDYMGAIKGYHDNFENIAFAEGISLADTIANGMWSGSVYPQESANNQPGALRMYGTWTATHSETGKEIGVKWFALSFFNEDNKIVRFTEYWDVNGLAVQIAAE
jgi:hypothetical protein